MHAQEIVWQEQFPEGFSIHISLSTDHLSIDQPLTLQLQANYPLNYQIKAQDLIEHVLWHVNPLEPRWALIKHHVIDSSASTPQTSQAFQIEITLMPLVLGKLPVSFFNVIFTAKETLKEKGFPTPIFEIESFATMQAVPQPAPLFPLTNQFPLDLTLTNREKLSDPTTLAHTYLFNQELLLRHTFPWLLLLVIVVGTILVILGKEWRAYLKARLPITMPLKSKINVRQTLSQLEELLLKRSYKKFYIALSELVRYHLSEQFYFSSATTTQELIERVNHYKNFTQSLKTTLQQFLLQADQVKYAHYEPNLNECRQAYQFAKEWMVFKNMSSDASHSNLEAPSKQIDK